MRKFLALGAMLLLAACASAVPNQTPASRLFAIQSDYTVLVGVAARYNELPRCERPEAPTPCSRADAVRELRRADAAAAAALKAAQAIVQRPGYDQVTASSAIATALQATKALQAALAAYDIR